MRARGAPLLAELHAHTTWSDGTLTVRELVDAVGVRGFDVLCVTDHVVRDDDPWLDEDDRRTRAVAQPDYGAYLAELTTEADRARERYDLLLIAGLELTYNDLDPTRAAHAVAIGLREHVALDDGIEQAIRVARASGAAIVAAHPFAQGPAPARSRLTQAWAVDPNIRALADRFELFNRNELFGWVADSRLPCVATGDVHAPEHVPGWKTLLPCERDEDAIVAYLRSPGPVYLARADEPRERVAA